MIDKYRDQIEAALQYGGGTHDFEDVREGVATGKMQLWPNGNSCAITEVIRYPKKRVLHVFLAGGKMSGITDMLDSAVEWGKTQGCTSMTISGRKGWKRVLARKGFEEALIVLERDFSK